MLGSVLREIAHEGQGREQGNESYVKKLASVCKGFAPSIKKYETACLRLLDKNTEPQYQSWMTPR